MSNDRVGPDTPAVASRSAAAAAGPDPRVVELRRAVARLRVELAGHSVHLADREAAEEELAGLEAAAAEGLLAVPRLRRALLVLTGALGSVSALALPLSEVHHAIDLFGPAPSGGRTAEPLRGGC